MKIRPMLAASFDDPQNIEPELQFLTYPVLASPKVDGIRWMRPPNDVARSRSWTPLPNIRFQDFMKNENLAYLDGEVIVGNDPAKEGLFNETQSAIMTRDDSRPFSIWVFDYWQFTDVSFASRTFTAQLQVDELRRKGQLNVNYLEHVSLKSPDEVLAYEKEAIEAGYEGIMLRDPHGLYKFGRSTLKQGGLIKVKRFADEEAEIIGFEALERNTNEQVRNAFGLAKRSSHRSGKVQDNLLGRLLVRSKRWGDFAIGSGFDVDMRTKIWENQEAYVGKTVTFKYQKHGTLEKPRTPIWKGFREE